MLLRNSNMAPVASSGITASQVTNLVPLGSVEGGRILARSYIMNNTNRRMVDGYSKQNFDYSCGISSLVLLINSLNLAYRVKYSQILTKAEEEKKEEEKKFFELNENGHNFNIDEMDITSQVSRKALLDMPGLQNVTTSLGFGANIHYACTPSVCESSVLKNKLKEVNGQAFNNVDQFTQFARDYIMRRITGLIAHYDLIGLGYQNMPGGRFSSIAGYDEETDRFLLMSLWQDSEPVWVKSKNLFDAMSSVDENSGLPRGLLHIHELLF